MKQGLAIRAPVSVGELLDKITILEIKAARIGDPAKKADVRAELDVLSELSRTHDLGRFEGVTAHLKSVNATLWDVEEALRRCERRGDFGQRFISLARSVYRMNDERARLKQELNRLSGSSFTERKSYV